VARPEPLRLALRILAAVPILTGAATAILGSAIIRDHGAVHANVESELRFYGVWWIGLGIFLASLAPRIEERGGELRVACALLFAGGLARLWALADAGRPATEYLVLMAIELVLAIALPVWQSRVARG
jgi:hypothetical protein